MARSLTRKVPDHSEEEKLAPGQAQHGQAALPSLQGLPGPWRAGSGTQGPEDRPPPTDLPASVLPSPQLCSDIQGGGCGPGTKAGTADCPHLTEVGVV